MKKIIFTIFVLLAAIFAMAYLYFSRLNVQSSIDYTSLYAAATNSTIVFSLENDKDIHNILKDQNLFKNLIGDEKFQMLQSLKENLIDRPGINKLIDKQNLYFGFQPGSNRDIDFLISTEIAEGQDTVSWINNLKSDSIIVDTVDNLLRITLKDQSEFYLGKQNRLLLLSNARNPIKKAFAGLKDRTNHDFVEYIRINKHAGKNTVASLHINFNHFPALLKNITPNRLTDELAVLDHQNAFATLSYNFSKEKMLFNGSMTINDSQSYYNLFAEATAQDININNILPDKTANYIIYAISSYPEWKIGLNNWFKANKDKKTDQVIEDIGEKYHLNLNNIFPVQFKNQFVTFQLNTRERLGAINLNNGDMMNQLLLDISRDYNNDIKVFRESDILYSYFGLPFKDFKKPYYTIIDNFMVFSNYASTLQTFLNNYRNNRVLVNNTSYTNIYNQLPGSTNISFYVNNDNSESIFRRNIYLPYYRHVRNEDGLRNFNSFIYQLSGDKGKFQTNLLLNKDPETIENTDNINVQE